MLRYRAHIAIAIVLYVNRYRAVKELMTYINKGKDNNNNNGVSIYRLANGFFFCCCWWSLLY